MSSPDLHRLSACDAITTPFKSRTRDSDGILLSSHIVGLGGSLRQGLRLGLDNNLFENVQFAIKTKFRKKTVKRLLFKEET